MQFGLDLPKRMFKDNGHIHVYSPRATEDDLPSQLRLHMKFGLIGRALSEKMVFENGGRHGR